VGQDGRLVVVERALIQPGWDFYKGRLVSLDLVDPITRRLFAGRKAFEFSDELARPRQLGKFLVGQIRELPLDKGRIVHLLKLLNGCRGRLLLGAAHGQRQPQPDPTPRPPTHRRSLHRAKWKRIQPLDSLRPPSRFVRPKITTPSLEGKRKRKIFVFRFPSRLKNIFSDAPPSFRDEKRFFSSARSLHLRALRIFVVKNNLLDPDGDTDFDFSCTGK
jgi:hypothetical protein